MVWEKNWHTSTPKAQFQPPLAPKVVIIRDFFPEVIFWDRRKVDIDSESLIYVENSPKKTISMGIFG